MKSSLYLLPFSLALLSQARAQTLPAPAPRNPTQPAAPTLDGPLLENPPGAEAPIIIGEPVRHQTRSVATPPAASAASSAAASAAAPPLHKSKASVAGTSIVGLSDGAAVARLRAALAPQLKEPLRLVIGDYQYTFLRHELGASLPLWPLMRAARARNGDVPVRLQVDEAKLVAALRELDSQVRQDFENTALNVGASEVRVKAALETAPIVPNVTLVTMPLPKIEKPLEAVEKPAEAAKSEPTSGEPAPGEHSGRFPYLVASFSTRYDASLRGRTTNLRMAARNIDGTVVLPNRVFSTNAAIGPRNAGAGWREAKMFVSGQVVSGTGAGICQAASTLYNAALLADVPIIERHAHSMRVMYVPPSRDAALMWGSKDFKFRNTTGGAIRISTSVSGGKFHVQMWGEKPRHAGAVRIESHVLSRAGGTRSEAFKIVGDQKIRLSRDSYKPHP